ncbi:tyrosine-type recombinase/integrase [Castellaniella hirudinis]|uniref:tyrosine-type recombinase/integrase n=1 Tax=Castellaniella hirudinis TaxID=1144617 RepID=UPI0039C21CC7
MNRFTEAIRVIARAASRMHIEAPWETRMTTLYQAHEQFLCHCQSAINLSSHTLRAYAGDLNDFQGFFGGQSTLAAIGKENLRQYILHLRTHRALKESTIKRRIASLKLLFRWARQEGMLGDNPFDTLNERIRLPKNLPRAMGRGDASRLRKAIALKGHEDYDALCEKTAVCLLLETGIRVGELASIQINDVSLIDSRISIHGKGNRQRFAYLISMAAYDSLQNYLSKRRQCAANTERLFITQTGRVMTPPLVRKALRRITTRAGIETHITPHMLRHTCATQWLEDGLDIRYVQKLLGHHSISTTEIYTQVTDQGLRKALSRIERGRE